ncbi:TIGR02452 family protein [Hippea sp. KM1]|uniref:TIGR02452 family protein n=1 Tax=Hippea sp. KM1 TaxID=944481 RepID=UPI00046CBD11|nr:TIGR02452 family protein [Hippea sp. KM1]
MSIQLEGISVIIPIEKIEKFYPGGFKKYKKDRGLTHDLEGVVFDDYIVRESAANPMDVGLIVDQWEELGLRAISGRGRNKKWKDICVVDLFDGPTLACDWISFSNGYVSYRDNKSNGNYTAFDPVSWIKGFNKALKEVKHDKNARIALKKFRKEIFEQTVEIVKRGFYEINGKRVHIDNMLAHRLTHFYDSVEPLKIEEPDYETNFSVIEADCLETASLLKKAGYNPCVLNMASNKHPGGNVEGGAGAQEENIFRRTNIFLSLFQFSDIAYEYGVERNPKSYPIPETGGIYSEYITVFRSSEDTGYSLLNQPYILSIVSVAAVNMPEIIKKGREYWLTEKYANLTKEKIRTMLRISAINDHDSIVLSAFGCGAFKNPPNHIARLFKEVFEEDEFKNRFRLVVFSIIDDHNSWKKHNPRGNILPFLEVFG